MYESAVGISLGLITTYGLWILLVVFALEGALLGKVIPTRALFIATVIVLGSDTMGLASVFLAAVVGSTAGQLVVFGLVRRTDRSIESLPGRAGSTTGGRFQNLFDRWGMPAIAVSNVLPVVRGTLTVPAAMSDTGLVRFSSASVVGTAVYAGGLIAFAVGVDFLLVFQ